MALSSACDLVTTVVSFLASAAVAALFFTAGLLALALLDAAAEVEVLAVFGFGEASVACLDFTDFETGMNTSRGTNTHKHTKKNGICKQTPHMLAHELTCASSQEA
jgi:hypothetical protein